jgi:hypothetical protein
MSFVDPMGMKDANTIGCWCPSYFEPSPSLRPKVRKAGIILDL